MSLRRYNKDVQAIKTGHSAYCLNYHVVWVCKYRRKILNPGMLSYLKQVIRNYVRQQGMQDSGQLKLEL